MILLKPFFLLVLLLIPLIWLSLRRFPGYSTRRGRIAAGLLRSAGVVLIALALADPRPQQGSDEVNVFFCLDGSRSVGVEQGAAALQHVREMAAAMGAEDRAGLIVFGAEAQVELGLSHDFAPQAVASRIDWDASNLHAAVQLALGQLPQGAANRIVLLSDGRQNRGDAAELVGLARALAVPIFSVALTPPAGRDPLTLDELLTPETAPLQTPFAITLTVTSAAAGSAELSLLRNDMLFALQPLALQPGRNVFHFSDTLQTPGLYLYKAVVHAPDDATPQNNVALSFTRAAPRARVLYLTTSGKATDLMRALEVQGLEAVQRQVPDRSLNVQDLIDCSAVILDNVPSRLLSLEFMADLSAYVRDMGGGLLMIGGPESFGAGRWGQTPVEEALPVFSEAPAQIGFPGFGLVLLIDKSASMSGGLSAQAKIEAAKKAAFSAVEMLNPTDRVGVLAFDTMAQWAVEMIEAERRREIAQGLSVLRADGGTDLQVGLQEALAVLKRMDLARKHVIVLSDGLTLEADFGALTAAMRDARITVSTVALGTDADIVLMSAIAAQTGGRSYYAEEVDAIPRIFAGETSLAVQQVIVEDDIEVRTVLAAEMLKGLPAADLPPLQGMVLTFARPGAEVLLDTGHGPLLATRTYGLGRSVAFTSDLAQGWAPAWTRWPHYGQFVGQMVKWAQPKQAAGHYTAAIDRRQARGHIRLDVLDDSRRLVNHLVLSLNVRTPSRQNLNLQLAQTAPGRYETEFAAAETGAYYLTLYSLVDQEMRLAHQFGFAVSYSDEYARSGQTDGLLQELADQTGGRLMAADHPPADLFRAPRAPGRAGKPLWPYLVLAALAVFVGDVALRKILSNYGRM